MADAPRCAREGRHRGGARFAEEEAVVFYAIATANRHASAAGAKDIIVAAGNGM